MGWFIVNVLIPMIAPLALVFPFRWFPLPPDTRRFLRWTAPIKDGQLAWTGLAFCAAGAYELQTSSARGTTFAQWMLGGLIFLMVANGFVAALGGVFPSESEPPTGTSPWRHYPGMTRSIWLSTLSSVAFAVVHFMSIEGKAP